MRHAKKGHRVISMDILEHLQKLYPALTKKQKTIADYLIANPEELSGLKGAVSGLYPKND